MKKLTILIILIVAFTMVTTACSSLTDVANDIDAAEEELDAAADTREEELDATADAYGDSFDAKYGLFDDIGDDLDYVADADSEDDLDDRADEIGDEWDDRGDAIDDKYDDDDVDVDVDIDDDDVDVDVDIDDDDVDVDVDIDEDDVDLDVDIDPDPGQGAPSGGAADDVSYGICNAMTSLDNSVAALLSPALTTPEAYAAAFDVAQGDFWTLREAAHGQYPAEFDAIVKAAVDFEALLTSASDAVQRSNIVVQAGRIAFAVNALDQQVNCSCSP